VGFSVRSENNPEKATVFKSTKNFLIFPNKSGMVSVVTRLTLVGAVLKATTPALILYTSYMVI